MEEDLGCSAYNHSHTYNDCGNSHTFEVGSWSGINFISSELIETKRRTITFVVDSKDTTSTIMTKINSSFGSTIQNINIQD
jgi:hypothetical protein